jgi:hypothetical protein
MSVIIQVTEIVFGSLTTIVLVSLSYVWLWDWRERAEDSAAVEKQRIKEADEKALIHFPPDSAIEPYAEYFLGTPCPKCGDITRAATRKEGATQKEGVITTVARGIAYRPTSCTQTQYKNLYRCEVKAVHIHVRCETCKLHWLIAPKQKGENHAARTV